MATTQFDKALYKAPDGRQVEEPANPYLEIEVVDDDAPEGLDEDGSMVISLNGATEKETPEDTEFGENLAEHLDEDTLHALAFECEEQIDNDRRSRADWERTYKEGLKLLGLKIEERTEPWDGACGLVHPMITEAVVRFQAETTTETFPAQGPVRTKILGRETPEKKAAAARVEEDMNYELTECMPDFRPEHERMLFELPAVGAAFKKVYYDDAMQRPVSMFVSAEDVLLPYGTTNIFVAPRVTHVMRKTKEELTRLMESGFYREVDLGDNQHETTDIQDAKDKEKGETSINDDRFIVYETHADLLVTGDSKRKKSSNCAHPYIFTFIKGSRTQVLGLRRNWVDGDKAYTKRQHFVQYNYVPGFGAYGYGLFHLIGGYANGATSLMRQLIDAGTLSNLPGGLKARGLRIKGDDVPIAPGEFRDVDIGSGTIKENILPLPYKEPSVVLAGLLEKVIEDGRRFAATADLQISDMSAQAPVGTTLAILERQLKVLTAVQARTHFSLKQELKLLKEIIRDYTPDEYKYDPATGVKSAKKGDYDLVDVIPVSDPNASTLSQRVVQHQAAIQMAQMAPEIYDMKYLHRQMLDVLGFKDADKVVPLETDMKPQDPVTENMNLLKGKPVKAFMHQDHMAHLAVHKAAMQDPMIQQAMAQNPKNAQILAAATAHLAEHVGYMHRQQMEAQLGITLPPEGEQLPPEVEAGLSSMMAQAAQQVLAQNQALAALQAQQAAANDPLLALQREELQVKKTDAETNRIKVFVDAADKADKIELEREKLMAQGVQIAASVEKDKATIVGQNLQQGMKLAQEAKKAEEEVKNAAHDRQIKEKQANADHELAVADQQHRHRLEDDTHELAKKSFDVDTAHKAHQMVSGENMKREEMQQKGGLEREKMANQTGIERERMQMERNQMASDDDFRRQESSAKQGLERDKLKSGERMENRKLAVSERQNEAKLKSSEKQAALKAKAAAKKPTPAKKAAKK